MPPFAGVALLVASAGAAVVRSVAARMMALSDLALVSTITKRWAVKFEFSLAYDSLPPFDVKSYDVTRTASVSLQF
jgi:hypothetical protein